jgi:radical SAM protein
MHGHAKPGGKPPFAAVDFDKSPFLVIWETTQSCALACTHCRASARPWRDPEELTTEEGCRLLDEIVELGTPLVVFSGGDPTDRPDLCELIAHAKHAGLRTATIPAATERLDRDTVRRLQQAGVDQMALSLDFPRPELHDAFRGVPGAFAKTLQAAAWARELGVPLQINTTVCSDTAPYLEEMARFVEALGIVFWEVFFLVPMGRGSLLRGLSAAECEKLFAVIHRVQQTSSFVVKVTEAPHYRRHVAQALRHEVPEGHMPALLTRSEGPGHTVGLAPRGVNAGNGFLFVSHRGEIFPSGFLPLAAGNVRQTRLSQVYRENELFRRLRRPDLLEGRCGRCEYRQICGGSRSRAYSLTGDPLATDPWCAYVPRADRKAGARAAAGA